MEDGRNYYPFVLIFLRSCKGMYKLLANIVIVKMVFIQKGIAMKHLKLSKTFFALCCRKISLVKCVWKIV